MLLALWRRLIRSLSRQVTRRISADGVPVTVEQRQQMARRLHPVIVAQRQRSYQAAVAQIREAEPLLQPAPIREYPPEAVEAVLKRATEPPPRDIRSRARVTVAPAELDSRSRRQSRVRVTGPSPENRTDSVVVREVAEQVSVTLGRHVQQAARDAVADTAEAAGDEIRWARVLAGDENCAFCAMLASRGPVYRSEQTALGRGGARLDAYHDNCDCRAVLVREGEDWEGREQQEWLETLWMTATDRMSNRPARNMFRRAYRLDGQFQEALAAAREGRALPAQSRLDEATRTALADIDGPDDTDGIREAHDAFLDQIKALNQQVRRPNRTR